MARFVLYFSKGERQALTLLLSLITMAWIAIIGDGLPSVSQIQTPPLGNTKIKQDSSRMRSNKTALTFDSKRKSNPIRTKLKSLPKGNLNAPEGNQNPISPLIPKTEKWPVNSGIISCSKRGAVSVSNRPPMDLTIPEPFTFFVHILHHILLLIFLFSQK